MGKRTGKSLKNGIVSARNRRKRGKKLFHNFSKTLKSNPKITLLSLLVIICLLQAIEIWVKNELSVEDFEYKILLVQIIDQKKQNSLLYQDLLNEESFTSIYHEALNEGFVNATYILVK